MQRSASIGYKSEISLTPSLTPWISICRWMSNIRLKETASLMWVSLPCKGVTFFVFLSVMEV